MEMPKKRPARVTQQTSRRRRIPRRPEFSPGPTQPEKTDLSGNPIFADDVATSAAAGAFGEATGPVETRPEWIESTPQPPSRQPGRRTAQLRRTGGSEGAARIMAGQLPTFEHSYIVDELRRIAIIAGSLFAVVIILAIVMR
jgi:hypothetical protein